jgi:hypothetical protein
MEINNELLAHIERLAAAAYTPTQIAFALGQKPYDFKKEMMNENGDVAIAYFKGFYSSELSVRESAFKLARDGSSPAQTLALKYFDETRKTIIKNGITEETI